MSWNLSFPSLKLKVLEMFMSMLKKPGPRRRSLPVVPRVPAAGLVKAVPSKYGGLGSWPPRIWTTGLICDALCPWPPAFTELLEPMVNGRGKRIQPRDPGCSGGRQRRRYRAERGDPQHREFAGYGAERDCGGSVGEQSSGISDRPRQRRRRPGESARVDRRRPENQCALDRAGQGRGYGGR